MGQKASFLACAAIYLVTKIRYILIRWQENHTVLERGTAVSHAVRGDGPKRNGQGTLRNAAVFRQELAAGSEEEVRADQVLGGIQNQSGATEDQTVIISYICNLLPFISALRVVVQCFFLLIIITKLSFCKIFIIFLFVVRSSDRFSLLIAGCTTEWILLSLDLLSGLFSTSVSSLTYLYDFSCSVFFSFFAISSLRFSSGWFAFIRVFSFFDSFALTR